MDDLLENFLDSSGEKINLEFESTTNEEGIELIDEYLKDTLKQMIEDNKKGFDKDCVKMSKDLYSNIISNLNFNLNFNESLKNSNFFNLRTASKEDLISNNDTFNINEDKKFTNKRKSYAESRGSNLISESITSEDNTPKFKKDLIGQNDNISNFGKVFSLANKLNKIPSKFIIDENEEDKINDTQRIKNDK